jgi:hypothetical protein
MRGEGPTSPLGGRNRKGAGAPQANRNARGKRALRFHLQLKKRLLADHLQLLVLAAAVAHLEQTAKAGARLAKPPKIFAKQLSCRSRSYASVASAADMQGRDSLRGFPQPLRCNRAAGAIAH